MWRDPLGTEASVSLGTRPWFLMVLEEVPMAIVRGLDLHRKQITFDVLDTVSGEVRRGRISPADRQLFRGWLSGLAGQHVELAVEGCTGWRFVIEGVPRRGGVVAHLAEPAEVAGLRGAPPARQDRPGSSMPRHLRDLLLQGRLPECCMPPQLVLETRAKVRLYKDLADQRTGWQQRMHATLYHLGAPAQRDLLTGDRDRLARDRGGEPGRPPGHLRRPVDDRGVGHAVLRQVERRALIQARWMTCSWSAAVGSSRWPAARSSLISRKFCSVIALISGT